MKNREKIGWAVAYTRTGDQRNIHHLLVDDGDGVARPVCGTKTRMSGEVIKKPTTYCCVRCEAADV